MGIGQISRYFEYSDIPLFNEDIEKPTPEVVKRIYDEVRAADAIWFLHLNITTFFRCPENLIDWLSRPRGPHNLLFRKPTAVSGITIGMTGTVVV